MADETITKADVPQGAVEAVLHWVGDDLERAEAALEAEGEREKPRSGLLSKLEAMFTSSSAPSNYIAVLPISHSDAEGHLDLAPGDEIPTDRFTEEDVALLLANGGATAAA